MANYRQTHVKMWRDSWFIELPVDAKLCWIYLFTNENSTLAGLYEITLRQIAFDTCLNLDRVKEILAKFEADNKLMYANSIIWIYNMEKYHSQGSPKIKTRKALDIASINDSSKVKKAYIAWHEGAQAVEELMHPRLDTDRTSQSYTAYEQNIGALTPLIADAITLAVEEYTDHWVMEAIKLSAQNEKRNWKYCEGILKRWKREGFSTEGKPQPSIIDKMGPYLGQ